MAANQHKIVLVGGGITGELFLHYFIQLCPKGFSPSIIHFHQDELYSPCSLTSTGLVALNGAKRGTPRGDELTKAYYATAEWVNSIHPMGVEEVLLESYCQRGSLFEEDYLRRFLNQVQNEGPRLVHREKAYLFDMPKFLTWLKVKNRQELQGQNLFCYQEMHGPLPEHYEGDLFLATGAYSSLLAPLETQTTEVIPGSFLLFDQGLDYGEKSFAYSLEEKVCLYRAESKTLQIGVAKKSEELPAIYERFKQFLSFTLPPLSAGRVLAGLRHRGPKRMPVFAQLQNHRYALWGTYKNGISYPHALIPPLLKKYFQLLN